MRVKEKKVSITSIYSENNLQFHSLLENKFLVCFPLPYTDKSLHRQNSLFRKGILLLGKY